MICCINGSIASDSRVITAPSETSDSLICPNRIVKNPIGPRLAPSNNCISCSGLLCSFSSFPVWKSHAHFSCPIDSATRKSSDDLQAVARIDTIAFSVNPYLNFGGCFSSYEDRSATIAMKQTRLKHMTRVSLKQVSRTRWFQYDGCLGGILSLSPFSWSLLSLPGSNGASWPSPWL